MTEYALYLESGPQKKKTMVHVLDLLGCIAEGDTTDEAISVTPGEIRHFHAFLKRHGEKPPTDFTTTVAEHVIKSKKPEHGNPNRGFPPDFEPLTRDELALNLNRLRWLGEDLAALARDLPGTTLHAKPKEKGRPIYEIFRHIADAEPEYGRAGGVGRPEGVREISREIEAGADDLPVCLDRLWTKIVAQFENAPDADLNALHMRGATPYTPKRGLRRALEHPWEHYREIQRRLGRD